MTSLSHPDSRVIDIASPEFCWSHLRAESEGRMSYRTPRRPTSLAVLYTLHNQEISIPVAAFNDTAHLAVGAEVTLEVTGSIRNGALWTVRATGCATLRTGGNPGCGGIPVSSEHPVDRRASGMDHLLVPVLRIRGFYETSLGTTDAPATGSADSPQILDHQDSGGSIS
jgi:hypothetical protein